MNNDSRSQKEPLNRVIIDALGELNKLMMQKGEIFRARAYQKLDVEEQRAYEEKLIREGRAFELDKIKRAEDFQKDMYDLEKAEKEKLPAAYYADKYYGDDSVKGENRKVFEDNKLRTKFIEKFGSQYEGFLNGGDNDRDEAQIIKNKRKKEPSHSMISPISHIYICTT